RAVKPGDDFFRYANGAWLKRVDIPSDRTRFGAFDILSVLSENRVHAILDDASAKDAPATTPEGRAGAAYKAFMDEAAINKADAAPLQHDLARVKAADTRARIAALMGDHHQATDSIFGVSVQQDAKHPERYAIYLRTGGLGLPDKDYYLKDTPKFVQARTAYQAYVAQMLTLAGWPDPQGNAQAILAFETEMAKASWDRAEQRDRDKTYNPTTVAALAQSAPGFDWRAFMAAADLGGESDVILSDNTAFAPKAAVFARTPLPVLQAWIAFGVADETAPVLPARFVEARFNFRNKTLAGQPELQARWKRGVAAVNGMVGEDVGQLYVAKYFPPEAKAQMLELVGNLKTAFRARIERLTWMEPSTKEAALAKLAAFNVKIAYPNKWKDYAGLSIRPDDAYGNQERSRAWEWAYRRDRLHKPVDREEWGMTPQTVNAYYSSTMNEIVFPAAILQPPFFDPKADPAVNYGGIGGVIGHEMTHGFDDQGRKSNGQGVLADWWTAQDAVKFKAKTDALGQQYATYALADVPAGEHINGQLTMGENMADSGGINLALDAYHASLHGRPAPVIDGLTGDQRVFLAWAQVWRGKSREDALIQQIHTDPHSPNEARVNAVVRNVDAWYTAFDVKPDNKLYVAPGDRVHTW
ncbi:MAG: M13 family metallopeptidase, partial [Caulobacteraceae bacterium]|nr:M13 family metallopeptidase [Caulobacter sp.]